MTTMMNGNHLLHVLNLSCINQPVSLQTKSPPDLSWIEYRNEVAALNQRIEFSFLSRISNGDTPFYVKTKDGVELRGFDQLPFEMRAYGHDMWIPVQRKEATLLLVRDNILNRTVFYEGLSPGYYQFSLNYTEVAYGCWFTTTADNYGSTTTTPRSNNYNNNNNNNYNNYIYANTHKTLIFPPIGSHSNWIEMLDILHTMFNEVDSVTGCIEEDGNQFIQKKTCRDKYLCTMALKYGYDSVQMPSRREFIYCNDACATTRVYGACPPVELRRSDEDNIPCNCSDKNPYMNCDYDRHDKAIAATATALTTNTVTNTVTTSAYDRYRPYICAVERKKRVQIEFPIIYSILFQNTLSEEEEEEEDEQSWQTSSSSSSSSSSVSSILPIRLNMKSLLKSKTVEVTVPSMQANSTTVATRMHPFNNDTLIAFSFSISSTPIGIIGITPRRYSSINDQTREIIDEIMCLRVTNGAKYQVLILTAPLNEVNLYADFVSSLNEYVDMFIFNHLDQIKNPTVDYRNDNTPRHNHYHIPQSSLPSSPPVSCNGDWYDEDSNKVVILKNRYEQAFIELNLQNKHYYQLSSNVI